jgi:methylamine dehydrogenase accessory protein MauD
MLTMLVIVLCVLTLGLGFLLMGALRSIQRLTWRLDQLEATTPRRIGRDGLAISAQAPSWELPDTSGERVSLSAFRGRPLLLAFMQTGCEPCHQIVPRLNRLVKKQRYAVVAIVHGKPDEVQAWGAEMQASFPVLVQEGWDVSRRYEVFATPFAFVLDADGAVRAKGIISSGEYLDLLLSDASGKVQAARKFVVEEETSVSLSPVSVSNA